MSNIGEKFNFDGETNVEDVENRVKKSATSIEAQVESIGKKFKTAFKDIFLSFLGPMALLMMALNYINKAIDERNTRIKEAQDAAASGENPYIDETTSYMARKRQAEDKDKKQREQAQTAVAEETKAYIEDKANAAKVFNKLGFMGYVKYGISTSDYASKQSDVQQAVRQLNEEAAKKERLSMGASSKDFKSPEGFSNIVGVGANPVLEAMTAQLDEQRKQTFLLQQIANGNPGGGTDFTKGGLQEARESAKARMYKTYGWSL